jgi:cytochrome c-type biogenesis protein CcmH
MVSPNHHRHCEAATPPKQSRARAWRQSLTGLLRCARNDGDVSCCVRLPLLLVLLALLLPATAGAVEPDEVLADAALEARARALSQELRCVVCQNQSIDDSNAGIARDLRILVRERLVAGDSDEAVLDYVVARYGDYVLLDPPFKPSTWALWVGPPLMAVIVATLALLYIRAWQRRRVGDEEVEMLSPTDRAALDALVERIAADNPPPPKRSAFRAEFEDPHPTPDEAADGNTDGDDGAAEPAGPKPA